jgi:hypothetical protein
MAGERLASAMGINNELLIINLAAVMGTRKSIFRPALMNGRSQAYYSDKANCLQRTFNRFRIQPLILSHSQPMTSLFVGEICILIKNQ